MKAILSILLLCILTCVGAPPPPGGSGSTIRRSTTLPLGLAGSGGQTLTDNFNRADNADLGANWTPVTDQLQIIGNTVQLFSGNDATERYSAVTWTANQSSEAKITAAAATSAGVGYGVSVRCASAANTCYRLVINGDGEWELGRVVAGAFTSMASGTTSYSAGAVLKLSAIGTTITSTYNGSQLNSQTEGTISTGSPGLAYSSSIASGNIDDWTGIDGL